MGFRTQNCLPWILTLLWYGPLDDDDADPKWHLCWQQRELIDGHKLWDWLIL